MIGLSAVYGEAVFRDHVLDLILLGLVVLFGISGYRQGFIVGMLSFVGFVGGAVLGIMIAPPIAGAVVDGPVQQALLAILIAFVAATLGQLGASSLGAVLRNRVTWDSARIMDAVGGTAVSVVSLLLVAWFLGTLVAVSPFTPLSKQVNGSQVLKAVDGVMPNQAESWFSSFKRFVGNTDFPQVFGGLGGEPLVEVRAPDPAVLSTPALKVAQRSIVKVVGTAPQCERRIEGTGFVYAPERVMTNAHVVAGVRGSSTVISVTGKTRALGRVVLYDPRRDLAVIYVPGLKATPLKFNASARTNDEAIVAGFPKGHPSFTTVAARIRAKQNARGPDIYHSGQVTREIYAIRGKVEAGNSGGPLLATNGTVYGVIFAAAVDVKEDTGYALTAEEAVIDAREGQNATQPVSTESCTD